MFIIKQLIKRPVVEPKSFTFNAKPLVKKPRAAVIVSLMAEGKSYQQAIREFDTKARKNVR